MRAARDAPVDSMGCERCSDPAAPPRDRRFQTLVSLMLSSQTKDPVTFAATKNLIRAGLGSASALAAASEAEIDAQICKVGFHNQKSKFLKLAGAACEARFGGDAPASIEALCSLKGVGPKMAFIAMSACWGKAVGIGVDTHVHRIANRLRWVKTTTPEQTRDSLQALLPRGMWAGINILLVGFGQQTCTPLVPKRSRQTTSKSSPTATTAGSTPLLAAPLSMMSRWRKSSHEPGCCGPIALRSASISGVSACSSHRHCSARAMSAESLGASSNPRL
jgi:endonuclease-3